MRRILIISFLLGTSRLSISGQNLVYNGNFDEVNICSEYHQACSPVGWRSTSYEVVGYYRQFVRAFSGDHFLPLIVENQIDPAYRTYWQTRLLCPLEAGRRYTIRFYVGCWGGRFYPENLGVCFPDREVFQPENRLLHWTPALEFRPEDVSPVSKSPWQLVQANYIANGGEKYILLGNFLGNKTMHHQEIYFRSIITYCIDDFSIVPDSGGFSCTGSAEVISALRSDIRRHSPPPLDTVRRNTAAPLPDTIRLDDILFAFDSTRVRREFLPLVDSIARLICSQDYDSVEINGHSDDLGTAEYNLQLSLLRARTVGRLLADRGVKGNLIRTYGYGETQPLYPPGPEENRRRNRRVEIIIHRRTAVNPAGK